MFFVLSPPRLRAVAGILIVATASTSAAAAQTRKPINEEWDQVRPLFKLVEEVAAGKPAPSDLTLTWQSYFLNADAGVVFVPFTLKIERGEFTSFPVAMYVRVVVRGAPAPAPGPRDPLAQYPFEDAAMFFGPPSDGRISRAFTAAAGDYDVYVAFAEKPTAELPQPRMMVHKQAVHVPDLKSDLAVSSIIVADKIEIAPSNKRLSYEEQLDEPYALWGNRLTPALRDMYKRTEKLSVIFLVYNTAAAANDKPDVEVQYNFYRRTDATETFVTRTTPELFNTESLRREFSLAAGDLIIAGRETPLATFTDGDYHLKITVTDKIARKSLTRDVNFSVLGP